MSTEHFILFIIVFPAVSSLLGYFIGTKNETYRNVFYIATTFVNLCVVIYLFKFIKTDAVKFYIPNLLGTGLFLNLDVFRYVFVFLTAFIWFLVTIYSAQYLINYHNRNRYYLFFMLTYSCTIGMFLSNNMLNLFTFFEIMSFSSYPLIVHDEDEHAHKAGITYIWMTTISGLLLLMGIFICYSVAGTLHIEAIGDALMYAGNIKYVISAFMIIGFGIKAGIVPLHIWLPKAHPAAPTPASAVLSAVLVKTGIFGIMIVFCFIMKYDFYTAIFLMLCGFVNMILGGFYAMYQTNIKTTLAYSSISQIGYLLLGVGSIGLLKGHEAIAVYGTLMHIVNHGIFKALLFMGVGIIYMITHTLNINELRGFGRFKPVLKSTFLIGSCAIIGFPGFSGFASKTMIHHALTESAHYSGMLWLYAGDLLFYTAGAFITAYLIKLYVALFAEDNSKYYPSYKKHINLRALLPMVAASVLVVAFGIFPNKALEYLVGINSIFGIGQIGKPYYIEFFTFANVFSSVITILLGIVIYRYFILTKLTSASINGEIRVNGKINERIFINPLDGGFSLESDIYIPALKFVFKHISAALHKIDNILFKIYQTLLNTAHIGHHIKRNESKLTIVIENLYRKTYK